MWDLLHSCAFLLDEAQQNINGLVEPLILLLPCVHCRNSFVGFYESLGRPDTASAAEPFAGSKWVYEVHRLVNRKLAEEKAKKFVEVHKLKPPVSTVLISNALELAKEPTFEYVRKRYLVNSEEPIQWRSLAVSVLAIVMNFEGKFNGVSKDEMANLYSKLKQFLEAVKEACNRSRQDNAKALKSVLDAILRLVVQSDHGKIVEPAKIKKVIQMMKYSRAVSPSEAEELSSLIKAGACIKGTCA